MKHKTKQETIELHKSHDSSELVYEYSSQSKRLLPFKRTLFFWASVVGGLAIGTAIFLFFMTVFVYLFLPIFLIASVWSLYQYMRLRRM